MAVLAAASVALPAPVRAQTPAPCDGRVVARVTIQRGARTVVDRARVPGWSRPLLQTLLLGAPTRDTAIRPFLQLREGSVCTELRRAESERLLRLQPYLADATVRVVDEADGRVAIEVETVDDLRRIVGLGLDGARPTQVELGDANIAGGGRLAAASWRDGGAYRDGFGVRAASYHLFGGPNLARLALVRAPLGSRVSLLAGRPFYTDFQNVAGTISYDRDDSYATFVRPEGDPLALQVVTERQDLGMVWRLNNRGLFRVLAGGIVLRERRTLAQDAVIITDSGLVAPLDRTLAERFRATDRTRVGLVAGVRALRFAKVAGFDALEGTQDVSRGVQLSTILGATVGGEERGPFGSAGLFLGAGTARSYVGLRTLADAQGIGSARRDVVASGRFAWYAKPSPKRTRIVSAEFAGAWQDNIPYQLTLDEPLTGVRGYEGSRIAGARRAIVRLEQRATLPGAGRYVGMGVAAFADGAHMWRGSVPFGTTATRASAGVSLLAAVPRSSRGLGRVDVAVPLVPDDGAGAWAVRVGWQITGREFWREPAAITRARVAGPTSGIFVWP